MSVIYNANPNLILNYVCLQNCITFWLICLSCLVYLSADLILKCKRLHRGDLKFGVIYLFSKHFPSKFKISLFIKGNFNMIL